MAIDYELDWGQIYNCVISKESSDLLMKYGDETNNLDPILIQGLYIDTSYWHRTLHSQILIRGHPHMVLDVFGSFLIYVPNQIRCFAIQAYSVVLNKRAARLFIFDNFSYLHALIRYLHVY